MKPTQFNQFFTRQPGNTGARLILLDPVTHLPTDEWLTIASVDSDTFKRAEVAAMRAAAEINEMPNGPEKDDAYRANKIRLVSSLIIGWSFDREEVGMECNDTNKVTFLTEAPQVAQLVNESAVNRSLFMPRGSASSEPTAKPTQSLTVVQPDQQPQGESS